MDVPVLFDIVRHAAEKGAVRWFLPWFEHNNGGFCRSSRRVGIQIVIDFPPSVPQSGSFRAIGGTPGDLAYA